VYLWQFADVRVSEEWFMSRPKTQNNKGIVDRFREPKLSYALVKRLFGGK
jgi:beta-glucuronidase